MTDPVLIALITAVQTVILTIFGFIMTVYQKRTAQRGERQLTALSDVTVSTHKLVNSWAIIQLRLLADAHRRIATNSGDPADARTAEDTEERLRQEEARQRDVLQEGKK